MDDFGVTFIGVSTDSLTTSRAMLIIGADVCKQKVSNIFQPKIDHQNSDSAVKQHYLNDHKGAEPQLETRVLCPSTGFVD